MFVLSLKSVKHRAVMLGVCLLTALIITVIIVSAAKSVPSDGKISLHVPDDAARRAFLASYGWTLADDPLSVGEVVIPAHFDEVYSAYNDIQLAQGFDLQPYASKTVERWVYSVTNYPGYIDNDCIHATLLIYKDRVIGGDICSVEINGFMHGFSAAGM